MRVFNFDFEPVMAGIKMRRAGGFSVKDLSMAACSSALASECAANCHQLLDNLAFTHLAVIHSRLTI